MHTWVQVNKGKTTLLDKVIWLGIKSSHDVNGKHMGEKFYLLTIKIISWFENKDS